MVAGYTAGRGSRKYFGALVLGLYDKRELKFIGNVGTGFDESKLEKIFDRLQELKIPRSPFKTIPALREEVEWVKPRLVARVKYGQWTDELHLRAPVFLSLRNDRTAEDCTFDAVQPAAKPPESEDTPHASEKSKGRTKKSIEDRKGGRTDVHRDAGTRFGKRRRAGQGSSAAQIREADQIDKSRGGR